LIFTNFHLRDHKQKTIYQNKDMLSFIQNFKKRVSLTENMRTSRIAKISLAICMITLFFIVQEQPFFSSPISMSSAQIIPGLGGGLDEEDEEEEANGSVGEEEEANGSVGEEEEANGSVGEEEEVGAGGSASLTPQQFDAQSVYTSNSIQTDADVTNLVILIPEQQTISRPFIPQDATIVEGTTVIWINGQKDTVHGIAVQNEEGEELFSNSSIPYRNGASFTFDEGGTYTYSDTQNPSVQGTINVIGSEDAQDIVETNSTTKTVGAFVVPSEEDDWWQIHLNSLGFNIKSSYDIQQGEEAGNNNAAVTGLGEEESEEDTGDDSRTFYVYTQKLDKYGTVVYRVDTKIDALQEQIVPSTASTSG
jgi:plastocyanin